MRTLFILFLLLQGLFLVLHVSVEAGQREQQPKLTREFVVDGPAHVNVRALGGNITVEGHDSNKVKVEVYVRLGLKTNPADDEVVEALKAYDLHIRQEGNMVSVIVERKGTLSGASGFRSLFNNADISFVIYVPRQTSCKLKSSGGSITLMGVKGKHEVKTNGGHLKFLKVEGELTAATSGGRVLVEDFEGSLNTSSSGGGIKLYEAKGTIYVFTSGGNILLDRVSGSIEAKTTGGHIQATLLALEDKLSLKSSGGNIKAIIPKDVGLNLDLKADRVKTELIRFDGVAKENRVNGMINGGGIEVVMVASAGKISLEYQ